MKSKSLFYKIFLLILTLCLLIDCAAIKKQGIKDLEYDKFINTKSDITMLVNLKYNSTLELGYSYDFTIIKVLKGKRPDLLNSDGIINNVKADGFLIIPPVSSPEIDEIYSLNEVNKTKKAVLNLLNTNKNIENIEKYNPRPGTGIGSFLPPGTITKSEIFYQLISIKFLVE